MRNYNSYGYYRRTSPVSMHGSDIALWFGLGLLLATGVAMASHPSDDQPTKEQATTQLQAELSQEYQPVTGLTVNSGDQTFGFQTEVGHEAERCTGDYAVRQAKAVLAGNLVCKPVVTVSR